MNMSRRRRVVFTAGLLGSIMIGTGLAVGQGRAAPTDKIVVDGSTTVGPIAKAFAEYFMQQHPGVNVTVSESGSGNGAKGLINGVIDVAAMSRFMKANEYQAAVAKGILPVAHVVALDGLAVIVHPGNPVQGLSLEQVRRIYLGQITNWSEVGGPNAAIVVVSRDTNSGTYETFAHIVMQEQRMAASTEHVGSNGAARARVQSTPGAVAYVGIGFLDRTVKAVPVDGVLPDKKTIVSGRYPIARPLFLFTNEYPKPGSPLYAFTTLHLTKRGQEIVESIGFVPVTDYE